MSIFCKHIFKPMGAEFAYRQTVDEGSIIIPSRMTTVNVYVLTSKCLKCGKIKKEEVWERA